MAITISGIRIESVSVTRDKETGGYHCESSFALVSSVDKVVARQSSGGYHETLKIEPGGGTMKALEEFLRLYKADIGAVIGLDVED